MDNELVQTDIGSVDWNGGAAPAGGTHTGTSTIVMNDGKTYVVAHGRAEVFRKLDLHAVAPPSASLAQWVAFDVPARGVPIVLQPANVAFVL